jgi:RNA polymerase sigma-B factor
MNHISATELFHRWHQDGDRRAREELVVRNLPLARKLAGRYVRTLEPFEDLYQVASLGLVKAIDRFDPERGLSFASFAVPTILGELKRHFRDKGWAIHIPRGLQELVMKVQTAQSTLDGRLLRSPTVEEIAEHLECPVENVIEALDALTARTANSLDEPLMMGAEDEVQSRHDLTGSVDEGYGLAELRSSIKTAIARLSDEDQRIMSLRFGQGLTQREIAGRIGVSQMQVSRILSRIRVEVREELESAPSLLAPGDLR